MASDAIQRCIAAVQYIGFLQPHFLLIHSKVRNKYVESKGSDIQTMAISATGRIFVNPDFVATLNPDELSGVMCHELLHLVLMHAGRSAGRDPWLWNVATDMCINKALADDSIKLPQSALVLPPDYQGDIFAEAVYEWLQRNQQKAPQDPRKGNKGKGDNGGQVVPGAGCSPIDDPDGDQGNDQGEGEGDGGEGPIDWRQVAMEARALAQSAGVGKSAVATLLGPRVPKISWKKVIRHGFEHANARPSREWQSFSKRHRRSPARGPQFPGWLGSDPKIAMVIDVSGSMDRKWIDQIVAETKSLMNQFKGTSVYLVTHTSEVCWEGWIKPGQNESIAQAVSFSGGTDPDPAYEALRKVKTKWDTIIHMTDCEFFNKWPDPPGKHLIVGSFRREIHTKPPEGATVIMCDRF